jgi:hypothetical protein
MIFKPRKKPCQKTIKLYMINNKIMNKDKNNNKITTSKNESKKINA